MLWHGTFDFCHLFVCAGIVEPFESWYNKDRQRVDFYEGLDTYVFRQDLNVMWQVNPMIYTPTCFETKGPVDINPYLPDTTGFVLQDKTVQVNNQICDDWKLSTTVLDSTSTYDLYVSRSTGMPVRYTMQGYDSLIGSHYDLYVVDYINVTLSDQGWPSTLFDKPMDQCGNFPGPGVAHMNPVAEMRSYFPGHAPSGLISDEYSAFLAAHGKIYSSDAELRQREKLFMKNMHFVNNHQRKFRIGKATYSVALNHLADYTPAEMAGRKGRLRTSTKAQPVTNNAARYHSNTYYPENRPDMVDWRLKGAVTDVQDQGICGSCWSFGSTGTMEGAYFLKYGKLKVFAQQELMDCSWGHGNNACDGGEDWRAYDWVMENGGISFKENYGPYLMADSYCASTTKQADASIQSYVNITEGCVDCLMDALASVGPISVSIDASHPGLSFYTSGVYSDPECKNGVDDLDHSVLAVGYGTDPEGGDYWIIKNSWSTYWGDQGYIRIARKNNMCGVATAATYVNLK